MVRLIWTAPALDDLTDIRNFIAGESTRHATDEVDRILATAESLQQFPHLGKIIGKKTTPPLRQILSGNYRIIYRNSEPDLVEILVITHGSRLMDLDKRLLDPEVVYGIQDVLTYVLSVEEEVKIEKGLRAIAEGKIHSHEEIQELAARWLKGNPQKG